MTATQRMALARLHRATRDLRKLEVAPALAASCEKVLRSIRLQIERDVARLHESLEPFGTLPSLTDTEYDAATQG